MIRWVLAGGYGVATALAVLLPLQLLDKPSDAPIGGVYLLGSLAVAGLSGFGFLVRRLDHERSSTTVPVLLALVAYIAMASVLVVAGLLSGPGDVASYLIAAAILIVLFAPAALGATWIGVMIASRANTRR